MTIKRAIFFVLMGATLIALPIQCVIDPSAVNMAAVCIAMASSLGVLLYVGASGALATQPLSTFALLGFCVTTHLGSLLVQTASWTALSSYLYDPIYTYSTIALYQWIAVAAHSVYRFFSVPKPEVSQPFRSLFRWLGVYRTPSIQILWFMGIFGLGSFFLSRGEGVVSKIGSAFNFLTWAPFLIPFYQRELGASYANARRNRLPLILFTGAIAVVGLALNARQIMFVGVITIGLLYLLAGMRSEVQVTRSLVKKCAVVLVVLAAVSQPLSNLATSMAIAREWRGKLGPVAMIRTTYSIYRRPALIAAYRNESAAISRFQAYDERYIANPGLARLIDTKFYDNSLHFAAALSSENARAKLRDISVRFVWAVLPTPILDALGVKIDKEALDYSMGDYLVYLSRGLPLSGHKTGVMFGQGIVLFGPLFPILYGFVCIGLFWVMDLLTLRTPVGAVSISAFGNLEIWHYFGGGIAFEAVHHILYYFLRNFEQMLLIYVLVFAAARIIFKGARPDKDQVHPPVFMGPHEIIR